jgi:hypothetical protein
MALDTSLCTAFNQESVSHRQACGSSLRHLAYNSTNNIENLQYGACVFQF